MLPLKDQFTLRRVDPFSFEATEAVYRALVEEYGFEVSHRQDFLFRKNFPGVFELLRVAPNTSSEFVQNNVIGGVYQMAWVTADASCVLLKLPTLEKLRQLMQLFDIQPVLQELGFSI